MWITEEDRRSVAECLKAGWISSSGPYIDQFEERWAGYCGRRSGIAVANGTVALQLAVAALELPPGSEVILPSFTIISCAMAVVYNDAVPVLVDSDPVTGCMDPAAIEAKVTSRTRAIMPVHIYGHPAHMDPILEVAETHGLAVVEDAAEAHGAQYLTARRRPLPEWKRCGGFGDLSCFSFYANKLVATGEGGMVLTDDDTLAERLRSMRNLCFEAGRRFHHDRLGFNFRMTSIQAALGLPQIDRMEQIIERKRRMAAAYRDRLGDLEALRLPTEEEWARSVFWMYPVRLRESARTDAARVTAALGERGVETRPFFAGMHQQPALRGKGLFEGESYPMADALSRNGFYLPSGLGISEGDIERVSAALREVLG